MFVLPRGCWRSAILLFAVGCASLSTPPPPVVSAADAARLSAAGQPTTLQDLEQGRALFVGRCASCHRLPRPEAYTPAQWPRFVSEMTARAKLTPPEAGVVLRYLIAASQLPAPSKP